MSIRFVFIQHHQTILDCLCLVEHTVDGFLNQFSQLLYDVCFFALHKIMHLCHLRNQEKPQ